MTNIDLLRELRGTKCRCGSDDKHPHRTFCAKCYFILTPDLRANLYRRVGEGYEEAHAAALAHLKRKGRIPIETTTTPTKELPS